MENRPISNLENSLRFINIFLITFIVIFISWGYLLYLRMLIETNKVSKYDNLFTSGLYKQMFIEIIILGVFVPPYLNKVISGTQINFSYAYDYNSLLSYLIILKSYVFLRVYSYYSKWTSTLANSICQKYKIEAGIHFAIKAELKKRPYLMLGFMVIASLFFLGYGIRTFEYGIFDPNKEYDLINPLGKLENCYWLIIVTMTTVGYGEMYPKSHFGRFIAVIACIVGMLLVSLIVVSLTIISEFSNEEKKAYLFLKKLDASDTAECKAANVIIKFIYLRKSLMTKKDNKSTNYIAKRFICFLKLKKDITVFKNDYKLANNYALPMDETIKNLEIKLKEDLKELIKTLGKLNDNSKSFDLISVEQKEIKQKLNNIVKMQDAIAKYIVTLNNLAYHNIIIKK